MAPSPNEALDFILIRQKDKILSYIILKHFVIARCCLAVVRELWEANNYGYKYKELKLMIPERERQ